MPSNNDKMNSAKRQQILDGARRVFIELGFAHSSVEKIAKAAGVAKGTIYNYFDSKEALFVALIAGECAGETQLPTLAQLRDAPIEAVLARFAKQWLSSLLQEEQAALFRIVLAEVMQFPALGQLIESSGPAQVVQLLSDYLAQLNQDEILQIDDARLAAEQLLALSDAGIIRQMQLSVRNPSSVQIEQHVISAVTVFLRAYRKAN
ncbi:TetR/AcrR family transcriptional regulator [Deefgea salmonis]|uniref:TetR/AcrR family transcriptional regulator n=1 Tax=Deefgea salmonis TaxID=2875502 RepID=A0ABS8BKN2_9NEIS|nr:TetR/AcrR family transcriptional regulator [Deefgea salmonis]MCB5196271.1 TetR/AcrR family transcriptional regulator [Deefgea salmonis]